MTELKKTLRVMILRQSYDVTDDNITTDLKIFCKLGPKILGLLKPSRNFTALLKSDQMCFLVHNQCFRGTEEEHTKQIVWENTKIKDITQKMQVKYWIID